MHASLVIVFSMSTRHLARNWYFRYLHLYGVHNKEVRMRGNFQWRAISYHYYFLLTLTLLAISSANMFISEELKRPMFENIVCCSINNLLHYKVLRQMISKS